MTDIQTFAGIELGRALYGAIATKNVDSFSRLQRKIGDSLIV
jgi:hypothetical protein